MSNNDYWDYLRHSQELYHHGIMGQKWGVRRWQYKNGSLTPEGYIHYGYGKNRKYSKTIEEYIKSGKAITSNFASYNVGNLLKWHNDVYGDFTSALTDPSDLDNEEYGVYEHTPMSVTDAYKRYGDSGFRRDEDSDMIAGKISDDDLKTCNYDRGAPGTIQNCAKCSAVLELNKRGFTFQAGRQNYPSDSSFAEFWFDGAEPIEFTSDIAEDAIKSFGPKTSGTLSIRYPGDVGGHAMHWTVDDKNNFEIQDGQVATRYKTVDEMIEDLGADTTKPIKVYRLDNCEPNWDHINQDNVLRGRDIRPRDWKGLR